MSAFMAGADVVMVELPECATSGRRRQCCGTRWTGRSGMRRGCRGANVLPPFVRPVLVAGCGTHDVVVLLSYVVALGRSGEARKGEGGGRLRANRASRTNLALIVFRWLLRLKATEQDQFSWNTTIIPVWSDVARSNERNPSTCTAEHPSTPCLDLSLEWDPVGRRRCEDRYVTIYETSEKV